MGFRDTGVLGARSQGGPLAVDQDVGEVGSHRAGQGQGLPRQIEADAIEPFAPGLRALCQTPRINRFCVWASEAVIASLESPSPSGTDRVNAANSFSLQPATSCAGGTNGVCSRTAERSCAFNQQ